MTHGHWIGVRGAAGRGRVDPGGTVHLGPDGPAIGWAVRAGDRWTVPAAATVRQDLVADAPVVETRQRAGDGDLVHRAWAVPDPAAVVVELVNEGGVPVAVALVAAGMAGPVATAGERLVAGDRVLAVAASAPARVLGPGEEPVPADAGGGAVWPVVHGGRLRLLLPLGEDARFPGAVPTAEEVARGWAAQADAGTRWVLPQGVLATAAERARRGILLAETSPGAVEADPWGPADPEADAIVLDALGRTGHDELAAAGLVRLLGGDGGLDPAVVAAAAHWDRTADSAFAAAAAAAAGEALAGGRDLGALEALAVLFAAAGDERAAGDARAAARRRPAGTSSDADGVAPDVEALARAVLAGAPLVGQARLLREVDALLVTDTEEGVDLVPGMGERWRGQPIEVHGRPTRHGRLSFALRWHGRHPALIWELAPAAGAAGAVLRASALAPGWSGRGWTGEELVLEPTEGLR